MLLVEEMLLKPRFDINEFEELDNNYKISEVCLKGKFYKLESNKKLFIEDLKSAEEFARRAKEVVERNKGSTEVQASYIIGQKGEKT